MIGAQVEDYEEGKAVELHEQRAPNPKRNKRVFVSLGIILESLVKTSLHRKTGNMMRVVTIDVELNDSGAETRDVSPIW